MPLLRTLIFAVLTLGMIGCESDVSMPQHPNYNAAPSSSSSASSTTSSTSSSTSSTSSSTSSTSSTSSSGSIGDALNGKAIVESDTCVGCHSIIGDGTFGGIAPYDPKAMDYPEDGVHTDESQEAIAAYITEFMPQLDPTDCIDTCADDVAAYLWELINTEEPEPEPEPIGDITNGQTLLQSSLCSGCHTDNGNGTATTTFEGVPDWNFDVNALSNLGTSTYPATVEGFALYLTTEMPPGGGGGCDEQCGKDVAAYLWQFRD